eukprot:4889217-Amphidinium_carterae.1
MATQGHSIAAESTSLTRRFVSWDKCRSYCSSGVSQGLLSWFKPSIMHNESAQEAGRRMSSAFSHQRFS